MATRYWLKNTLGTSYPADPSDVVHTKLRLQSHGYYDEPKYGVTEYPDTPLFEGIRRFQKDNGLQIDGLMRPGGPTETRACPAWFESPWTPNPALRLGAFRAVRLEHHTRSATRSGELDWAPKVGFPARRTASTPLADDPHRPRALS
jgi:peptidoglycan hydrolase-like protein with peptidoglycan-binding domain